MASAGVSNGRDGRALWRAVERVLGAAAGAMLFSLTILTCIDVVARYWFNAPVRGAYELTEVFLATLIFLALPLTTSRGEHVEVDLFEIVAGGRVAGLAAKLTAFLSAAILAIFAWRLFVHGLRLAEDGTVTNSLSLPLSPLAFLASFSCAVSAILALGAAFAGRHAQTG
ncbi:TRAP transporter small permease [Rhizobiales bacterium]|uniref:TRAP transporter small permease n=1 Tax=Hongsoonwoonella zoysiae TaxID=2821844 RepID=UPI00155F695A|nr:TRAP transporter small permease [Hongsoonwoonella zoysiae]NRG17163.1 TRAP transporter small permease [Hongsoonwoonella zoysiae]